MHALPEVVRAILLDSELPQYAGEDLQAKELRRANEILKLACAFSAQAEFDRWLKS